MAYRCGSKKEGPPRAILVRFYSAKMKNEVYFNKKNLKGSGITIREDLTATRMKIVKEKMSIYGNKSVWTNDGKILWLENGNGKLDNIKNVLNNNRIDILAIGETWLDSRIETTFVNIDGYTFLRRDRGSRGGGVGLYISNSLKFKIIPSSSDIEQLWVSIHTSMREIICGVVYRPPLQELVNFLDHLELSFAKALGISKHVFCLGDFNVDYANPGTSSYNLLEQFMENFEVAQLITDFTRVSENSSTLIDLILTTSRCLVSDSGVQNCHFSDHDMIFSILSLPKPQPVLKHIRNYKSIDVESFRSDLANKKVNEVIYIRDIDKKIDYLNSAILSVLDVHAPYKLMRFTKKPAPWLTDNLRLIMNLRDTAKKKFIQTQTVESWNEYKKARNFATQAVKNEKKAFFSHLCKNKDSKQIWRQLQNLNITKSGQTVGIPHHLKNVDTKTKVIIFSPRKQYEEVSGKIKIKINGITLQAVSEAKNLGVFIDSKLRYKTHALLQIRLAQCSLDPSDPIIFCLTILEISLTPKVAKTTEKRIARKLFQFALFNNLIDNIQHGFLPGGSISTNLLHCINDWSKPSDAEVSIYLDFSKAFYRCSHDKLPFKLEYLGIRGNLLLWMKTIRHNKGFEVWVSDALLSPRPVLRDVLQVSVMGTSRFLPYSSDLPYFISSTVLSYADDTKLIL
nr:unnamed protein product [Callosobruchus chinensis]